MRNSKKIFHSGMATVLAVLVLTWNTGSYAALAEVQSQQRVTNLPSINKSETSLEHYRAPFYELIEPGNVIPGKVDPYEPHYAKVFKKLLAPELKREPKFINRLTSGPSTKGEFVSIDGQTVVIHIICQQHRCEEARLAVLYRPADEHMVGLLWDKCKLREFGSISSGERDVLIRLGNMPANAGAIPCSNRKSRP